MLEKQEDIDTKHQSHKVHHNLKLHKAHQHASICPQYTYLSFRLLAMAFTVQLSQLLGCWYLHSDHLSQSSPSWNYPPMPMKN
jgi:hypothetical protein